MKISDVKRANEHVTEVQGEGYVATVTLMESEPGAGDWVVVGIGVNATDGSTLSADRLRNFAWANVLESARRQASAADVPPSPFARPSDPPPAFRADRRGRAARTERDYAELAFAYLALPSDLRRKAASTWAERFHRKPGRWRADIAKAKRYIEDDWLTDEGMDLVFGDKWRDALAVENAVDDAEETLRLLGEEGAGTAERAKLEVTIGRIARENGWSESNVRAAWRRQLQRNLSEYYASGGE
ncbi:hypothetical protein [Nocardioides sp. SYSU DS0651]|uniref:hypothetical protein n=1 Tax=Nocardioides sp. SYSU DS0651 TaxID=3415955 RepID=UPI003F4BB2D7